MSDISQKTVRVPRQGTTFIVYSKNDHDKKRSFNERGQSIFTSCSPPKRPDFEKSKVTG